MLKFFDRYLIKEVTYPFLIGLMIYTFVMLMNEILISAELFITQGVPLKTVINLLIYLIPSILAFSLPMSVLMGVLAGMSRLSSDYEIIAFRSVGISLSRLLRPILIFALICSLVTAYLTLFAGPRSNHKFIQTISQAVFSKIQLKIKPREFNESIPNMVIYIQDISSTGKWENILVSFATPPQKPRIILAKEGRLDVNYETKKATLYLTEGTVHSYLLDNPERYSLTTFSNFEEEIDAQSLFVSIKREKRVREKDIKELFQSVKKFKPNTSEHNSYWVEIHKKFALPFACLIFSILGLPLGISTRKGGRTTGFTISLGIILIYYILITAGENLVIDGKISPFLGIWGANIIIGLFGLFLFYKSLKESPYLSWLSSVINRWQKIFRRDKKERKKVIFISQIPLRFPNILDRYILRKYLGLATLILLSLLSIFIIVTFFERIDNIYEHQKPISLLFQYLWFYLPQMIYYSLPITALTAALLTFGLLTKSNEITAMKACGLSLYRLIIPVIVATLLISFLSFLLQENILPFSNKKAEEIWNKINDIPPRTYKYLDRRWVFGKDNRIYHYSYFDHEGRVFSHLSIFEIDSKNWTLMRRIYAKKGFMKEGYLSLENTWLREFDQEKPTKFNKSQEINLSLAETASYFVKEWKEPDQMNYLELRKYIQELEESGFETIKFKVDLNYKLSFPLVSLIMTLIAIPFSFSMGKRGALFGIGLSIVIAMIYWATIGAFKSLGFVNFLPPLLAAWGPNLLFGAGGVYLLFTVKT